MDIGVVKRLAATFLVGGIFGAFSQGILWVWRLVLGQDSAWAMGATLVTLGFVGAVLFVFGIYQKIEARSAMGAVMPFSGLVSAVATSFLKGADEGGTAKGVLEGFKFFLYVLGMGSLVAALVGVVVFLVA